MSGIVDRRGGGRTDQLELGPLPTQGVTADTGLTVDERSALCLLALARDLLSRDHHAVAMMIDYAMIDVARRSAD
ncbi:hypothetical protein [Aureimonas sp. AU12]|uniref:hypothetical protein n=1 Tax=Aureimonas sp. AU12 TaxID=1638161 RepID=UPI000AA94F83|nr:hypothetical protein [Aureimonas sp. AU12]